VLFLDVVTIVCTAVLVGNEAAVWIFINPILRQLDERSQGRAVSLFAARLGKAMPFWYALSLLLLILEAFLRRQDSGGRLLLASCCIWVAVIILTMIFLVPINNRLANLDSTPMTDQAKREHRKWDTLHKWRVVLLAISLICLLVGIQ
jgi:uncharacterized membrane protein